MTFKDIKLVEAENIIYIPQPMAWALEAFLKRDCPALEYEMIPKWKIKYGLYGEADVNHFLYLHKIYLPVLNTRIFLYLNMLD